MMWGIRLMELCYKLGDFTVKTELYNEAVSYYKFYLWANLWYQQLRAPPTIKDPFFESRTAQYQDYDEKETVEKETFDITAVDTRILDTGLFCEPVGSFPHFVANKSTVQSAITFDSFELAKQTLKNAGLGYDSFILTFDSGASRMSSGVRSDFKEFKDTGFENVKLDGIASGLKIQGIGIIHYDLIMDDSTRVTIRVKALYVPALGNTRLISPQGIRTANGRPVTFMTHTNEDEAESFAELWIKENKPGWQHTAPMHTMKISYDRMDNLPKHMASLPSTAQTCLKALTNAIDVTAETNQNLTGAQKELLKWHFRLGHLGFQHLRWLMRSGQLPVRDGKRIANCDLVKCAACEYGKATKRPDRTSVTRGLDEKEMELKQEDLHPGQRISVDHYQSAQPGRLYSSRGSSKAADMFKGGVIYVDHATGFVDVRHLISLNAAETIKSKLHYEKEAYHDGVMVQAYHTDNGVFTSREFLEELIKTEQKIRFSGSGAAHQNGVAERGILTVVTMARTMMLHSAMRHGQSIKPEHWPQAMDYAVWIYNRIPRMDTGISPLEMWSRSRYVNTSDILVNCHTWGCPIFVLEPKLRKSGVKIPKWAPRSRQGVYMGFSKFHSSLIALVLNKSTGSISPQFHVVFDDGFTTVPSGDGNISQESWLNIITLPTARLQICLDQDDDPDLSSEWLEPHERAIREQEQRVRAIRRTWTEPDPGEFTWKRGDPAPPIQRENSAPTAPPVEKQAAQQLFEQPLAADPISFEAAPTPHIKKETQRDSGLTQTGTPPRRSKRRHKAPILYDPGVGPAREWKSTYVANLATTLEKGVWTARDWEDITDYLIEIDAEHTVTSPCMGQETSFTANAAKKRKLNDPDTPNYFEAMSGESAFEYYTEMQNEINNLEKRQTWTVVPRSEAGDEPVVPGTWAFKRKRYPDGRFRKHKSRFCVRGDIQKLKGFQKMEDLGKDLSELVSTYAPVVSWVTVRLMLILALILGLKTKQIDFSNAFAQAELEEPVYLEIPQGFSTEGVDSILKLKKSLYGQIEAPRLWYEKLKGGLVDRGFRCSELDPCLFIRHDIICFTYVDDVCFFYRDEKVFQDIIQSFNDDGDIYNWEHTVEGEVNSFLGITITKEDGSFKFTQQGLIDKVLKASGMTDCNPKPTPCSGDGRPLGSDKQGLDGNAEWSYPSLVGMLLYLASNSRPDIAFAVHQCARFTHAPKASHEAAVLRICRYLHGTRDEGLILRPSKELRVDCYVDADFAGLFGTEDVHDPICAKSRSGYVITVANCPLMWVSKLQTEIALSTQHSEYVALSTSCRDLLPIKAMLGELMKTLDVTKQGIKYTTKSTCFEDNNACIALAKLRRITPQNRHIGSKYHWFREHVRIGTMAIEHVESEKQLADIFTKNLTPEKFVSARRLLCGW